MTTTIFTRMALTITAAPLYYLGQSSLCEKYLPRLSSRLSHDPATAQAFLDRFRADGLSFQGMVISHIDRQLKRREASAFRRSMLEEGVDWIRTIRRGGTTAALRMDPADALRLRRGLRIGEVFNPRSSGAVLQEVRYLRSVLSEHRSFLSPPLHEAELDRGDGIDSQIEFAAFGVLVASNEQSQISLQKSEAWSSLEDRSIYLLRLARLEFSDEVGHPDYPIRVELESLDEKLMPQKRTVKERPAPQKLPTR